MTVIYIITRICGSFPSDLPLTIEINIFAPSITAGGLFLRRIFKNKLMICKVFTAESYHNCGPVK